MKIIKDYHIHSIYSKNQHGKSTPEEIVQKAIEVGLKEIAISDHGPRHYLYGISKKNIVKLHQEIKELNIKYKDINILQGMECNLLSYKGDSDINDLVKDNCDIIMAGFHYGVIFKDIQTFFKVYILNFLGKFSKKINNYAIRLNTDAICKFMEKNPIDILTHPGEKIPVNIAKVAEIAVKTDTILEVNSSHKHLSLEDLNIIKDYDIKVIVGSDAHHKDDIGNYTRALDRLEESQFPLNKVINLEV